MKQFLMYVDLDGFEDDDARCELADMTERVSSDFREGNFGVEVGASRRVMDLNGNACGHVTIRDAVPVMDTLRQMVADLNALRKLWNDAEEAEGGELDVEQMKNFEDASRDLNQSIAETVEAIVEREAGNVRLRV